MWVNPRRYPRIGVAREAVERSVRDELLPELEKRPRFDGYLAFWDDEGAGVSVSVFADQEAAHDSATSVRKFNILRLMRRLVPTLVPTCVSALPAVSVNVVCRAGLVTGSPILCVVGGAASCRVHWMRSALAHAPKGQQTMVAAALRHAFLQPDARGRTGSGGRWPTSSARAVRSSRR